MEQARYIVGIDLGTTNIAAFYIDTEGVGEITPFPVTQVIAAGEVADQNLLPSFTYLPGPNELPKGAAALPWEDEPDHIVGCFARDQGAVVPGRSIMSAKSWLAHAGVDRRKPILPWGSEATEQRSPVTVTAYYLDHLRRAWNYRFALVLDQHGSPCRLEDQQVVITIPASFDETARELTLAAAHDAGLQNLVLLEEPLAAFYAWLSKHEDSWQEKLQADEHVLVVDVGGGTCDFSFMGLDDKGALHRFAVGEHLLLGGDNIDMAIGRTIEQAWDCQLAPAQWSTLVHQCRQAKERLLDDDAPAQVEITLLAGGSAVIGGAHSYELGREELTEVLTKGFFPICDADRPPPKRAGGIREMGLPYAAEPAITIHLLDFLRKAARIAGVDGLLYPDRILFNGGSMKAQLVRNQVVEALNHWFPQRPAPEPLPTADLSLAVAVGAAYYGRVRRGAGVKVRGGISRSYFLLAAAGETEELVCVMSRDTDENIDVVVPGSFKARTNVKAQFRLFSSATRLQDQPGDRMPLNQDDFSEVAPLVTLLQFGQNRERPIEVQVVSRLTEIGTLELELRAVETNHRWPLRFDLRGRTDQQSELNTVTVEASKVAVAVERIRRVFTETSDDLRTVVKDLEEDLDLPREDWPLPVVRELADVLLELEPERRRSAPHEARWLNLTGFCLRPGFGDAADERRLQQIWKLWFAGPHQPNDAQAQAEWWVLWRRIANGLKAGHQGQIRATLAKILFPKNKYRRKIREGDQAKREMWRCLGAQELISLKHKRRIGSLLIDRVKKLHPHEFWVIARLGARHLFHAPADQVLAAETVTPWVEAMLDNRPTENAADNLRRFALSRLAAVTGDRKRDLPPQLNQAVMEHLTALGAPDSWLHHLREPVRESREEQGKILGDRLPHGLHLDD